MVLKLIQIIQRQVSIGSKVTFLLKNGREITGILVEIGRDHVSVESDGRTSTVLIDMIGAWEVLEELPQEELPNNKKPPEMQTGSYNNTKTERYTNTVASVESVRVEPFLPAKTIETEILKKLLEIEARFQARLHVLKVELKAPDFSFPTDELKSKQKMDILTIWNRIKDKYEYAVKINELSVKFGRIQPIINDLRSLASWFPTSASVKRHLAYFYWLSGNQGEAIKYYRDIALTFKNTWDWFNTAVLAFNEGQEELACYSLEQFFYKAPINEVPDAWYLYVMLLQKFTNYSSLSALLQLGDRSFSEAELQILFETGIYLLKINDYEQAATELLQKWSNGQPLELLAIEAFNQLDDRPGETYQQMIYTLNNSREQMNKTFSKEMQYQP
ncbi:MAG TPA: hypothetical protein PKM06_05630 [Bacillota bacterium]|nr:hypothetical protein [Bacillota bacterium]HUM58688.1 hypothetical protein [Bacillota bacterium]